MVKKRFAVLVRRDFMSYSTGKRGKAHGILGPAVAIDPFVVFGERL
jgi:hypothetical protein